MKDVKSLIIYLRDVTEVTLMLYREIQLKSLCNKNTFKYLVI